MNEVNLPLVELVNATVDFGNAPAIPPLNFNVTRGEFVCLSGESGCGKSLALKLISGLVKPTGGEVRVAGDVINKYTEKQLMWLRRSMGLMVQEGLLLEDQTILENVMLPAIAAEDSFLRAKNRARLALRKCGIEELANLHPSGLSAGQKQIACLARAVINHPVLILADEPTAHLDSNNAQHLMDLLGEFTRAGAAIIVASHIEVLPQSVPCRTIELGVF